MDFVAVIIGEMLCERNEYATDIRRDNQLRNRGDKPYRYILQ